MDVLYNKKIIEDTCIKMEKSSMFVDWNNCHQNIHITQANLHILRNPTENIKDTLLRCSEKMLKFKYRRPQVGTLSLTTNSSRKYHNTRFQDILQDAYNLTILALAQK